MPMYEYICNKCTACWTELRGLGEATPGCCPDCGSTEVGMQVSLPSPPIFHGHGFHETDYGRKPR